jgi:5'-phosphate synthase pdxT subunit
MRIGILGYQGGISEHNFIVRKTCHELNINCDVINVRKINELDKIDGLIIPGGESTTITKLANKQGLLEVIRDKGLEGLPMFGTCAGAIILAKRVKDLKTGRKLMNTAGLLNIEVVRNYYGRQRESFELHVKIPILGDKPFRCIFIRAPAITTVYPSVKSLAKYDEIHIMVQENSILATTFHPELTLDTRMHKYFIDLIKR